MSLFIFHDKLVFFYPEVAIYTEKKVRNHTIFKLVFLVDGVKINFFSKNLVALKNSHLW